MKTTSLLIFSFLLLARCSDPVVEVTPLPYDLNYGAYEVGFKTTFITDPTRNPVPYTDWSGKTYGSNNNETGRTLPLHIWYPAEKPGQTFTYQHYVELITRQSQYSDDNSLAYQVFINQANDLKGDTTFTKQELAKLLALPVKATLKARELSGKFPLVVFPNGSSPAYQSIMSEFLASHGFVVVGLPLKGQFTHSLDASLKGIETGVDDLQFALQYLLRLPNVDKSQIALLANAIESSFCVGLASRNSSIKALVSLEGGFLSNFEQDLLNKTAFYEPQNLSLPILAIYAPHPNISADKIFHLKYSDRYFAHFPGMSEFHFLNFGMFEEQVPGIIGETKGDTKKGFAAASDLIVAFLEAQLNDDTGELDRIYSQSTAAEIDTLFVMEGVNPSPNISVMKNLFIDSGMDAIDSVYQSHKLAGDEQPFSQQFFDDYKSWLAWKKDPEYFHRRKLFEMAVESYPKSTLNTYLLAVYQDRTEQKDLARANFSKAKDILPKDADLDKELADALTGAIDNALNSQ